MPRGSLVFSASSGTAGALTPTTGDLRYLKLTGGTLTGQLINSTNGAASTPAETLTGAIFTGGSSTTTKPQFLIEPSGATSNNWSTSGTLIGGNLASGSTADIINLQNNASDRFKITSEGQFMHKHVNPNGQIGSWINLYGTINLVTDGGSNFICDKSIISRGQGIGAQDSSASKQFLLYAATDSNNCLELRNATNAQVARIFGTYTDSSNYERLSLITAAGDYTISPEAAGTGTLRNLVIGAAGSQTKLAGSSVTSLSSLATAAPSGGTAAPWKFGKVTTGAVTLDTTSYIELDISGTLYKIFKAV